MARRTPSSRRCRVIWRCFCDRRAEDITVQGRLIALGCGVLAALLASSRPLLDLRSERPMDKVMREPGEAGQKIDRRARAAALIGLVLIVFVTVLALAPCRASRSGRGAARRRRGMPGAVVPISAIIGCCAPERALQRGSADRAGGAGGYRHTIDRAGRDRSACRLRQPRDRRRQDRPDPWGRNRDPPGLRPRPNVGHERETTCSTPTASGPAALPARLARPGVAAVRADQGALLTSAIADVDHVRHSSQQPDDHPVEPRC